MADINTSVLTINGNNLILQDAEARAALQTVNDSLQDIETALDHKAEIDGYYQDMTVGNAEQLVTSVGIDESVPYNFRTSGGSADIGDRLTDKVVGGTIAWNQLVSETNTRTGTNNGITVTYDNTTHKYKASGTATGLASIQITQNVNVLLANHVYYLPQPKNASASTFFIRSSGETFWNYKNLAKYSSDQSCTFRIVVMDGQTVDVEFYLNVFDLTQMFGSTIADYVYSLEQSTAGAGVAWFKKLFPKDYYEYNAGELMSVQTSAHNTVGFNAWDEETVAGYYHGSTGAFVSQSSTMGSKNPIPVKPNTTYYLKSGTYNINVNCYRADMTPISQLYHKQNNTFTTPSDCYFIHISNDFGSGATYNHDICINLSWDGERDGEYEQYVKHTYPLDSDLVLRGIPKLDASNSLYYDGDTYESDGTVTRKYGIVDLGTLNWVNYSGYSNLFYINNIGIKPQVNASTVANILQSKYTLCTEGNIAKTGYTDGFISGAMSDRLYVNDTNYTDASAFKTAMSGVMLVYELATPTTETADPYQNPQIVDDFGTEEYVDAGSRDVAIPVGHETFYAANLKAKLEMSPDSPSDGDGDYIVRQTSGNNEYVKMVKELPTMPTTNGTYHLKVTVASGTPTLTWEADT